MWPRDGTVLTVSSRALVEACERLGVDTETLLRTVGIERRVLEDPDARLRGSEASALWARAYELSGDPVLSLHAAEACPIGAYKVIDYIGASAGTVGEAFRYAARYFKLINTSVRLRIDESGDPVTFDVEGESGAAGVSRAYVEYCLAVFVLHVRGATGVAFDVRRVTFTHRRPPDISEHERIFGCPARFETDHNRLYLDRVAWDAPTSSAHSGVLGVLIEHADLLLARLPNGPDLIERTRRAIGERLRGGDPSIKSVARELGMSQRSLQRHLRELDTTFAALTPILVAAIAAVSPTASAHPDGHDGEPAPLHVDDSYDDCFFDLHPELTQNELDEFAEEAGALLHTHQLSGAEPLGRGKFVVSLDYSTTAIDDSKGAWNNTMSHPEPDHYLGHSIAFPRLSVRVGVAERVDVGVWGTLSPQSNYGIVGLESKIRILEQDDSMPVSVAVRPTAASLLGPDEVLVADAGVDVSASRTYKGLSPYLGFAGHTTIALERSDDVDLDNGTSADLSVFGGLGYRWKALRVAAEAETGPLTTYSFRVGGSF